MLKKAFKGESNGIVHGPVSLLRGGRGAIVEGVEGAKIHGGGLMEA